MKTLEKRYVIRHGIVSAFAFISIVGVLSTTSGGCAANQSKLSEPTNALACRLANYGAFQDSAWTHLPSIGVKYIFLNVPSPEQVPSVTRRLAKHVLTAAVLRGQADLSQPSCVEELMIQLQTCREMGVKYMFLSPKHPGVSKEVACERLRRAGEIAAQYGVIIALETHPDLGSNGDVHLETMRKINHPNVRVNFDVANITYYNRNTDAVTELKKVIDYVATIELKDHNGQYETWNFPALGEGAVDIPGVLRLLKEHGYAGPLTIEIEGIRGIERNETEIKKDIADSVAYVRSLGEFK